MIQKILKQARLLARHSRRGESIVEVIVAVFVVALGSGVATTLIVTALQSNSFSRDNLIGLNLAVEGIEAMRTIRDTNWLRFSSNKEDCWNMMPDKGSDIDDCNDPNNLIGANNMTNFTVDLDPKNYQWLLAPINAQPLDLEKGQFNDVYRLGYADIDQAVDSDKNGKPADDKDLFATSTYLQNNPNQGFVKVGDSGFYRMVTVQYIVKPEEADSITVVSTVQWKSNGVVHSVILQAHLINYQKTKKV